MPKQRPYVLSIAGYDPSAGAGLTADLKTFEAHRVYGLSICSALTWQNDVQFRKVHWITSREMLAQGDLLLERFRIDYAKIGLIESWEVLKDMVVWLKGNNPNIKVVLDPILKASAGFRFHELSDKESLFQTLENLYLITPNWQEIQTLIPDLAPMEAAQALSQHCHVYLKGGHQEEQLGKDYLFSKEKMYPFNPKKIAAYEKHGAGCVLSAAITANLARGYPIRKACLKAKDYVTWFLNSNQTRLGYHKI